MRSRTQCDAREKERRSLEQLNDNIGVVGNTGARAFLQFFLAIERERWREARAIRCRAFIAEGEGEGAVGA